MESKLMGISAGSEMLFYNGPFPVGHDAEALPALQDQDNYPIKYGYSNVGVTETGMRVFAFYPHQNRFHAPPSGLIPIADEISNEDAVLFPFVETALQIVHDATPRLGETIAVFGLGIIGLLTCVLLRRMSVRVIAVDPVAGRHERAEDVGCLCLQNGSGFGEIVDIAINTTASEVALQEAVDCVAPEGTVIEASWFGARGVHTQLGGAFHRRRLTIRSSQVSHLNPEMAPRWSHSRRTETVMHLLRDLQPGRYVTHRFPLDRAADAYRWIKENQHETLQVVLEP